MRSRILAVVVNRDVSKSRGLPPYDLLADGPRSASKSYGHLLMGLPSGNRIAAALKAPP